jgi:uncharacterized membrane protein
MVTTGFLLAALCVGAFIYFIDHVAHSIEVSAIVRRIRRETERVLAAHAPKEDEEGANNLLKHSLAPALPTTTPACKGEWVYRSGGG